jgi:hypothetical protein
MMANPKEVDCNKTGLKWMTIGQGSTAPMEIQWQLQEAVAAEIEGVMLIVGLLQIM